MGKSKGLRRAPSKRKRRIRHSTISAETAEAYLAYYHQFEEAFAPDAGGLRPAERQLVAAYLKTNGEFLCKAMHSGVTTYHDDQFKWDDAQVKAWQDGLLSARKDFVMHIQKVGGQLDID